ncbi:hypothetical protein CAEBREN_17550 [Caenorhabditis brenneri]|uniref:Uncharacterized protein n=1 Tax=Caenorhabditis brenneri TaxID=135651 RepID=G0MII2_CAEBE|nr:hypothetical protein CAEBREN_17550 [Caenorhabditis brenneri]
MESVMERYLEKVNELKEDSKRLSKMIDEAFRFSDNMMSVNKNWEKEMSRKYTEEKTTPPHLQSNKRNCDSTPDGEDGPKPCKQSC